MNNPTLKHKILARVETDLAGIEEALTRNLHPQLDIVAQAADHILFSGGKRLRPLLMVLSAKICGYQGRDDKNYAAIFEYLHTATLLHDDLVDGASLRRNKPVAHSIWGSPTAVLVGDFLYARSLSIAATTGNLKVIQVIADITENMSQGEIDQLQQKGRVELSEQAYMEIIRRKTAVLLQGACRVGALVAGAPAQEEAALTDYGYHLGIAFQMADDLLDYTADTAVLGKEVGADLKEGKLTLPVIHALAAASPEDRRAIETYLRQENIISEDFNALVALLKKYNGVGYTEQVAAENVQQAKSALSAFRPSATKDILMDVADYALVRKA